MAGGGFGAFLIHSKAISFIRDIHFPCSKQDLITEAEENDAPQEIVDALNKLSDKEYQSIADVTESLAKAGK